MASDSCLTAAAAGFTGRGQLGSWQLGTGFPRFSSSCREVLVISRRTGLPRFSSSRQGGAIFWIEKSFVSEAMRPVNRVHELRTTIEGTVLYRNYRISNGIADRAHLYKVCRYGNAAKQQKVRYPMVSKELVRYSRKFMFLSKVCTYGTPA